MSNKDFGILSPFHLSYDGLKIERYFNDYIVAIEAPEYISDLYQKNVKNLYSVSFVHAAGWLLTLEAITIVGGFDPLFFHYGEDNDYAQRAIYKKFKIGFVTSAIMYHNGTNEGLNNKQKSYYLKKNFASIHLKNPGASFSGALLVFLKKAFDGITSAIVFRDFGRIKEECSLTWEVLQSAKKFRKSRHAQLDKLAYLES